MSRQIVLAEFAQKVLRIMNFYAEKLTLPSVIKLSATFFLLHIITMGMWGHLIQHITTLNGESFDFAYCANDFAGIISSYLALYVQFLYFIYSNGIKHLLVDMGNFENCEIPEGYAKQMDLLNKRTKYFIIFVLFCSYAAWVMTLLQYCEPGDQSDCGFLITAYMPFDIFHTPNRQIFALLQAISGSLSAIATVTVAMIIVTMIYSLTMQIRHLGIMLGRIKDIKVGADRKKQLNDCFLYHYRILNFTQKCNYYSSKLLFVLVFMVSVILSLTSYTLLALKKDFVTFVHMFLYVVCVSALCACGEMVIDENVMLFNKIYDSIPWDGDVRTMKDMCIMLMMAKSEISISTGLGSIGHIRLMMIYKSTYSFLTLMMEV